MIRALVDTNVLVVAPLSAASAPGRILDAWRAGRFELLVSDDVLAEVARTHEKPYFRCRLTEEQVGRFHRLLRRRATLVSPATLVPGVATHPEDDRILSAAVEGGAAYLVTGDRRFRQAVPTFLGVSLVTPSEFVDILDRNEPSFSDDIGDA